MAKQTNASNSRSGTELQRSSRIHAATGGFLSAVDGPLASCLSADALGETSIALCLGGSNLGTGDQIQDQAA